MYIYNKGDDDIIWFLFLSSSISLKMPHEINKILCEYKKRSEIPKKSVAVMWKKLIQFIYEKLKLMTAKYFNRRIYEDCINANWIVCCFVTFNDSSVVFYLLSNRIINFRNEHLFRICLKFQYVRWIENMPWLFCIVCERHAYSLKCNPLSLDGSIECSIKDMRALFTAYIL